MKAKRSPSFVAKSPFHQRRKTPVFPVPVYAQDLDLSEPKDPKQSTNYILEKIGTDTEALVNRIISIVDQKKSMNKRVVSLFGIYSVCRRSFLSMYLYK